MKLLILVVALFSFLYSESKISYDRTNIELEKLLYKVLKDINNISLKASKDESRALYNLGHFNDVVMGTTLSITIDGIHKQNSNKLKKYQILAPLKKGKLHLIVNKNSPFKTIYDLDGRNLNVGKENNSVHLFSRTLAESLNIYFKPHFYKQKEAISAVISGNLEATLFVSEEPNKLLKAYKEHIRLINIPAINGFTKGVIKKETYGLNDDINTLNADLLLIAKKTFINSSSQANLIIDNLLKQNNINTETLCKNNYYKVEISSQFNSNCSTLMTKKSSSKKLVSKKEKMGLNLNTPINNIEDVTIYSQALKSGKNFAGLNKQTETNKLKRILEFYTQESDPSSPSKLLIKSYSNTNDSYTHGKYVSKKLRKLGINRSYIIIKSFNKKITYKKENNNIDFLNKIIKFEIL